MKRIRTATEQLALLPVIGGLALLLAATTACSAAAVGNGAGVPAGAQPAQPSSGRPASASARPIPAPSAEAQSTSATADSGAAEAMARVQAALGEVATRDAKPGTEQIRAALAEAGFAPETVEVTAARTPTGLEADAVEAAVLRGRDCVVAQLRNGTVAVAVLPVLADGRCFAGSPA